MTKKDWQRHMAYEATVILGVLALLLYVCRLWPILLLAILGIFVAMLRLLFLSSPKVQSTQPEKQVPQSSSSSTTQLPIRDVEDILSFGELQTNITQWVQREYPNARWVWKYPNAKARFQRGEDLAILLNRAGGYREAEIRLQGKHLFEILYLCAPEEKPSLEHPSNNTPPQEDPPQPEPAESTPSSPESEDFSLTAFEWVESHLGELNELYNECIAQNQEYLLLTGGDLPEPAAWPALCQELVDNGLSCHFQEEGIYIEITRENRRKD